MPRLSRVRFVSVGHPQARMEDLLLDLRGRDGDPTDSTIWLRNGGGKSSILNLLFAIVRPSRREFLGGKADSRQRRLDDYVLPGDRAVTVAEWALDDGGRAVTGVFYEHRSGGSEVGALKRLFFAARVDPEHPETTLEGLPINVETSRGGARRTLSSFRQTWQALAERAGGGVSQTESQRGWQDILEKLGIDAGVFSYQVRMNQREGGADEIFRFSGPEDFADFLLELALDPELGDQVSRNVSTFRKELVRRKRQLVPESALVAGLIERVSPLAELADARSALAAELARARGEVSALSAWFEAEHRRAGRAIDSAAASIRDHADRAEQLEDEAGACHGAAAVLRHRAAALRARRAEDALASARDALAQARLSARVADAVVPLRDALRFERRARELRGELDGRKSESAPVREQLAGAASAYAAALVHRAATLRAEVATHAEIEARAEAESRALSARIADAREVAARASERARLISERLAAAGVARGRVEETGALGANEPTAAAIARLETDISERGDALRALQPALDALEESLESLDRQIEAERLATSAASTDWKIAAARLERAERDRAALESDPDLLAALELESLDLDAMDDAAVSALSKRVRRAQETILELKLARAGDERAAAHLERTGLLPPSSDVEALLNHLGDRVAVRSGWAWLEAELPAGERAARVSAAPAAASGLIVEPGDFQRALALLGDAMPQGPVLLATPAAFDSRSAGGPAEGGPAAVLGPADPSWYDREQGRAALAERRRRLAESDDAIAVATARYRSLAGLLERLQSFRSQHPAGWFAERRQAVSALERAASQAREAARSRASERLDLQLACGEKRERIKGLRRRRDKARRMLERVRAYAEDHERSVALWRKELAEARGAPESSRAAVEGWREQAQAARARAREAAERARACEADARDASARLREVRYLEGGIPQASAGDVAALADRYGQLCRAYEDGVGAQGLLQAARENETHAQRSRAALARLLDDPITEPQVASALQALADPSDAERARQDASDRVATLEGRVGTLNQRHLQSVKALGRAEAALRGAVAPPEPPPLPETAEAADQRAEELEAEAGFLDQEILRLREASREGLDARRRAEAERAALDADQRRIDGLRAASADLLGDAAGLSAVASDPEDLEDARRRLDALEATLSQSRGRVAGLDKQRRSAATAVRSWVTEARFEGLDSPLVQRFRGLSEGELERCAGDFVQRLQLRAEHLEALLSDVDRHRDILISQLLGLAEEGLSLLRAASNSSRLPDHLPGLGGGHFLKITTRAPADAAERREIIARLVDDLVDSERFPEGMELVQRAVRRLARPIQVKVLHPDPSLAQRMVGISEMARFSGGEQLTGAILLYCTLARLRARSRGRNTQGTSVLVLDNPVGRASRVRFLELQREVARAMGVQLVYTTGVNDHEALRTLPNIIRLRNARVDRGRGHRLVEPSVDSAVDSSVGLIASARITRTDERATDDAVVPLRVASSVA